MFTESVFVQRSPIHDKTVFDYMKIRSNDGYIFSADEIRN